MERAIFLCIVFLYIVLSPCATAKVTDEDLSNFESLLGHFVSDPDTISEEDVEFYKQCFGVPIANWTKDISIFYTLSPGNNTVLYHAMYPEGWMMLGVTTSVLNGRSYEVVYANDTLEFYYSTGDISNQAATLMMEKRNSKSDTVFHYNSTFFSNGSMFATGYSTGSASLTFSGEFKQVISPLYEGVFEVIPKQSKGWENVDGPYYNQTKTLTIMRQDQFNYWVISRWIPNMGIGTATHLQLDKFMKPNEEHMTPKTTITRKLITADDGIKRFALIYKDQVAEQINTISMHLKVPRENLFVDYEINGTTASQVYRRILPSWVHKEYKRTDEGGCLKSEPIFEDFSQFPSRIWFRKEYNSSSFVFGQTYSNGTKSKNVVLLAAVTNFKQNGKTYDVYSVARGGASEGAVVELSIKDKAASWFGNTRLFRFRIIVKFNYNDLTMKYIYTGNTPTYGMPSMTCKYVRK